MPSTRVHRIQCNRSLNQLILCHWFCESIVEYFMLNPHINSQRNGLRDEHKIRSKLSCYSVRHNFRIKAIFRSNIWQDTNNFERKIQNNSKTTKQNKYAESNMLKQTHKIDAIEFRIVSQTA